MSLRVNTGVPGAGKTANIVDTIEHEKEYANRPVFAHAVEEWFRAEAIRCENPICRVCRHLTAEQKLKMRTVETWYNWAPLDSIFVIDEAHYPFKVRRETDCPEHVIMLTESRHEATDWWFSTINVNMLDINVRRVIELHQHFVKGLVQRFRISHTECMTDDSKLKQGNREVYVLPKRSFGKYKSADKHVKLKAPIPRKLYWFAGSLLVLVLSGYGIIASAGKVRDDVRQRAQSAIEPSKEEVATVKMEERGGEGRPALAGAPSLSVSMETGVVAACVAMPSKEVCKCFDDKGFSVSVLTTVCNDVITLGINPRTLIMRNGRYGKP